MPPRQIFEKCISMENTQLSYLSCKLTEYLKLNLPLEVQSYVALQWACLCAAFTHIVGMKQGDKWRQDHTQGIEITHAHSFGVERREKHIKSGSHQELHSFKHTSHAYQHARGNTDTPTEQGGLTSLWWFRTDLGHFGFISQNKVGQTPSELNSSVSILLPTQHH